MTRLTLKYRNLLALNTAESPTLLSINKGALLITTVFFFFLFNCSTGRHGKLNLTNRKNINTGGEGGGRRTR